MNHPTLSTLIVTGVFALIMINSVPVVRAQPTFPVSPPPTTPIVPVPPQVQPPAPPSSAQPCVNSGSNILGPPGKQTVNQENQCTGTNTATGTCPTGSVLQNGLCVPATTGTCPTGSVLQNGVCVPTTTQTAPIANAGPDQTITPLLGTTVTLDGTRSFATTSGATILSYSWVQTSGSPTVTLTGANTAAPTFPAPTVSTSTPLTFSLTVTDSNGAVSAPDSVTITLNPTTQ